MPVSTRIGVISDTHGLLRPEALEALAGVDRILHAGDVGKPAILSELDRVAPVEAIRGNVDRDPWAQELPEVHVARLAADATALMIHDVKELAVRGLDPARDGHRAVIFGHSHQPEITRRDGVLYLNPGSAGPRRFRLPVTVALLTVTAAGDGPEDQAALSAEIVELAV